MQVSSLRLSRSGKRGIVKLVWQPSVLSRDLKSRLGQGLTTTSNQERPIMWFRSHQQQQLRLSFLLKSLLQRLSSKWRCRNQYNNPLQCRSNKSLRSPQVHRKSRLPTSKLKRSSKNQSQMSVTTCNQPLVRTLSKLQHWFRLNLGLMSPGCKLNSELSSKECMPRVLSRKGWWRLWWTSWQCSSSSRSQTEVPETCH